MSDLRKAVIRLASKNPELRADLVPLLRQASEAKMAATAPMSYSALKAIMHSLVEGEMVKITFEPNSSSSPPATRKVIVESKKGTSVYTSSGKTLSVPKGGVIQDRGDEILFQPTMTHQIRRVLALEPMGMGRI